MHYWPLRCSRLLLGQRGEAEVWLDDAELGEECFRLVVLDAGVDFVGLCQRELAWSYTGCYLPITSSPGTQLIGVVILCLSPVCSESSTRSTSAVLRPVEAG